MSLKRRSRGHQVRLKQIKDGKVMAKTRFWGFSVRKQGFRGLSARNQGLKHNYAYKQRGLYAKSDEKGLW
jgi:IS5 family transposase